MSDGWAALTPFRRWRSERDSIRDRSGVTMVIDTGLGPETTRDILATSSPYIDHWKFSFGTSMIYPARTLREKLDLVLSHGMIAYPGGTLFEACAFEAQTTEFLDTIKNLGFNAVEISDGTIDLSPTHRREAITEALDRGLIPVTEVGKKNPYLRLTPPEVAEQALGDFEAGAHHVIVEGRESGRGVGLYDEHGEMDFRAVDKIRTALGDLAGRVIWEAPMKKQQVSLIRQFGPGVGIGNVQPGKVLALETLRAGLRYETLEPMTVRGQEVSNTEGLGEAGKDLAGRRRLLWNGPTRMPCP